MGTIIEIRAIDSLMEQKVIDEIKKVVDKYICEITIFKEVEK